MKHTFPKTKLTRGRLSGPTQLLVAILLLFPASHLLLKAMQFGIPTYAVMAGLLMVAASPFFTRSLHNLTGDCVLLCCDERALAIRERPGCIHVSLLKDLKRIARDKLSYTLHLKNGRPFHLRRKDADPRLCAILDAHRDSQEKPLDPASESSQPPSA